MKRLQSPRNTFFGRNNLLLLYLGIYVILSLLLFDPKLFVGGDNAVYIILAESLAHGTGYRDMYLPQEPPHAQYPIGFPLLLALFIYVFGTNVIILKLVVVTTGFVLAYFFYRITDRFLKKDSNLVMAVYLSVPMLYIYSSRILSDIPFLCFSIGALYYFVKASTQQKIFYYVAFLFAMCAFFLRTAGITLIVAMVLSLVLRREFKYALVLILLFCICYIPWYIRNIHIPGNVSYIEQFLAKDPYHLEFGRATVLDMVKRVWENATIYLFGIYPSTLLPLFAGLTKVPLILTGVVVSTITIIGFARFVRKVGIVEWYVVLSFALISLWPSAWTSERFFLPLVPLFILYFYSALFWIREKIRMPHFSTVMTGIILVLNVIYIVPHVVTACGNNVEYLRGDKYAGYPPEWRAYFVTIDLIKTYVPQDKIILARKPEFVYLLSRHKSFVFPFTTDFNEVKKAIIQSDYIIIDNFPRIRQTEWYLLPVLEAEPQNYQLAGHTQNPEFLILKVLKDRF